MLHYKSYDTLLTMAKAEDYSIYYVAASHFLGRCEITKQHVIVHFQTCKQKYAVEHFEEPQFYDTQEDALRIFLAHYGNEEL